MTKHTRRDPSHYRALLIRRETERLTFSQLSEESGVPVATLQYWARKIREPEESNTVATGPAHPAFLEIDLSADDGAIEVVLPGDVRVAVKRGFDPSTLRAVARAFTC